MLIMSQLDSSQDNRVQNIKKQFEELRDPAAKSNPSVVKAPPSVPNDDIPRKVLGSGIVYTEVKRKPKDSSPRIKRSPAFRCDKIVRGGGIGRAPTGAPGPSRVLNVGDKVKLFEEAGPLQKPISYPDGLHHIGNGLSPSNGKVVKTASNPGSKKPVVASKNRNVMQRFEESRYTKPLIARKGLPSHQSQENLIVNNKHHRHDTTYNSYEDLSEILPLPPGPPPKKPPRTFTYEFQPTPKQKPSPVKFNNKTSPLNNSKAKNISPNISKFKHPPAGLRKSKDSPQNNQKTKPLSPNRQNSKSPIIPSPKMNGTTSSPNAVVSAPNGVFTKIQNVSLQVPAKLSPSTEKSPRYADIVARPKRPTEPPPQMPPRSKTESQIDLRRVRERAQSRGNAATLVKPPNKPDLSAKALLSACIPLNCASSHQYEALPLPQRPLRGKDISSPLSAKDISSPLSAKDISSPLSAKDISSPMSVKEISMSFPAREISPPFSSRDISQPLTTKDISYPVMFPRCHSEEHIYAEPFQVSPPSNLAQKPTGGVGGKPILLTSTGKQGLYYMSTPIEDTWKRPAHLPLCPSSSLPATPCSTPVAPSSPPVAPQKPIRGPLFRLATGIAKVSSSGQSPADMNKSKIQLLMNQAFSSVQLASPDASTDSDGSLESPVEGGFVLESNALQQNNGCNVEMRGKGCGGRVLKSGGGEGGGLEEEEQTEEEARKVVEMRKGYLRRTSSMAYSASLRQRQKLQRGATRLSVPPPSTLFQCILLVGLNYDAEKKSHVPYVKCKYPEHAEVPAWIELFVFPDSNDWPPREDSEAQHRQTYSLILTDSSGMRRYGYCRRVLPEGASMCIPLAYCIVTQHRASGFYYKVLEELESRHGQPEAARLSFLSDLQLYGMPGPGQSLTLPGGVCVTRPPDSRLEDRELAELFDSLQDQLLIRLVASLLLERRVLLVSHSLSKLSACVDALQSALYPFSWQHTLVPALPLAMLEVCHAPTPYIIGLLKNKDGTVPSIRLEDGMMVDLDSSRVLQSIGDEGHILPSRLQKALKLALQLVASSTLPHETSRNVLVSEAFVRMFVEVCGHYSNHVVQQQDGKKVFERESFIRAVSSRSLQNFLEWFTETALFLAFIETRLEHRPDYLGIFEQRAHEQREEREKSSTMLFKNYRAINRKGKTLGDRLKDWKTNF